ncbi:alpha/beta fold hydrolase [Carnobacterium funditum]|uniref:alpha/beta fold hydrolase n=1 Tax=Carnobacterium funditum TaxID=2752 RepID=UPI00054E7794|nr:alpha/beta fold hydrolase [Carnobacterium funditum]
MISIKSLTIEGMPLLEINPKGKEMALLPTVVFFHGWESNKESCLVNGYELAKKGFRAILPDAYLHGERKEKDLTKEGVEFWNVIASNLTELPLIREYYINKGLSDSKRFGVTGLSMGGFTTCAALTQFPWIKTAVVLMGSPDPVNFTKWLLSSKWTEGMELPVTEEVYTKSLATLLPISLAMHPESIANRYIHFWHGTKDDLVPYQPTFDFYEEVKLQSYGSNLSFSASVGVGHKVPYTKSVEMADFFSAHL